MWHEIEIEIELELGVNVTWEQLEAFRQMHQVLPHAMTQITMNYAYLLVYVELEITSSGTLGSVSSYHLSYEGSKLNPQCPETWQLIASSIRAEELCVEASILEQALKPIIADHIRDFT
jgi:hypothetical protein